MVKLFTASLLGCMALESLAQNRSFTNLFQRNTTHQEMSFMRRAHDGRGNNQEHPNYGSANIPFERLGQGFMVYDDKADDPRHGMPNPRQISNKIGALNGDFTPNKRDLSILFTIWGQFLDHDLTLTLAHNKENGPGERMDISIPFADPFFDKERTGNKKLGFERSAFTKEDHHYRNQINTLTAWHDSSNVYGSSQKAANDLRSFKNGKMKISGDNLLPQNQKGFFKAGDQRVNQNIALIAIHTLWVREHNRLCDIIADKNPRFSDEQIYTVARNYVIGIMQKITYKDWLPELLGKTVYDKVIGKYQGYDKDVKPNIMNQFATSAFRIGHPLLIDKFPQYSEEGQLVREMRLHQMFARPDFYKSSENLDDVFRGLVRAVAKDKSCTIVDDVRNFLFTDPQAKQTKMDLYALNIQRNRDHGIPSYNQCREQMGMQRAKDFSQMTTNNVQAKNVQSAYRSVDHVDLWVGIVCEKGMNDGVMGEFGGSMVGEGFKRIRDGDRFWYEHAFPKQVVDEIEKTTLSDVIKRNTNIKKIQDNAFKIEKKKKEEPQINQQKFDLDALRQRIDFMKENLRYKRSPIRGDTNWLARGN